MKLVNWLEGREGHKQDAGPIWKNPYLGGSATRGILEVENNLTMNIVDHVINYCTIRMKALKIGL